MSYPVQKKIKTGENVLRAAVERINWVFDTFAEICLSFSGGKDSTVLFHLVADIARRKNDVFPCCLSTGKRSTYVLFAIYKKCVNCIWMSQSLFTG